MSAQSKRHVKLDFSDLKAPGAAAAAAPTPRGPVTGVGLMSAALAGKRELEQQLQDQQQHIEQLKRERGAVLLDPREIRPSRWANRHPDSFNSPEFEELKAELKDAGGNVQPIKVRPLPPGEDGAKYELVFGHRRHRACLELGQQVLAIVEQLTDQELFAQMERENRGRQALSPWEQGVMYLRALDQGLFPSNRQLAVAVGKEVSLIGKYLQLARLPSDVVRAFPSPTEIQVRWGKVLADAMDKDADAVLRKARELAGNGRSAAEVFAALAAIGEAKGGVTVTPPAAPVAQASGQVGQGGVTVTPLRAEKPALDRGTAPRPQLADTVFHQAQGNAQGGVTVTPPAPAEQTSAPTPAGVARGNTPALAPAVTIDIGASQTVAASITEYGTALIEILHKGKSAGEVFLTPKDAGDLGTFLLDYARRNGWRPDPAD